MGVFNMNLDLSKMKSQIDETKVNEPKENLSKDLILSHTFKSELSQHNSPQKKQGLLSSRLLGSLGGKKVFFNIHPDGKDFNKRDSANSLSDGSNHDNNNKNFISESSNNSQSVKAVELSESMESEQLNIADAANQLFNNIFSAQYDNNLDQIDEETKCSFITKEQFEEAITNVIEQQFENKEDEEAQD